MNLVNKIIYSDTLNETEFLRTLAKIGIKTLGVRVMDSYDLSLLVLAKLGKNKKGVYLNNEEQDFIYYNELQPNCFNDASNIRSAINTFRDSGKGNSFDKLEPFLNKDFDIKYRSIKEAFEKYNDYKNKNNCYDLYDLLYELGNSPTSLNEEVIYFDDLPFSPLAVSVFSNYFDLKSLRLSSLISNDYGCKPKVNKCYGKNNEFACVLNTILNKKIKLDTCLVVLTDSNDITGLINHLDQFNIPFSSSLGFPFGQTNVGKMVAKIKAMKNLVFGVDAYRSLFNAPYFKKDNYLSNFKDEWDVNNFIKYVGWLRPNFDDDPILVNPHLYKPEMFDALKTICDDINNGNDKYIEFIENNVVDDKYGFEAITLLKKYLSNSKKYNVQFDVVVDSLLSTTVSQHISSSGALHICSLSQAFSSIRENVFVIGLDSSFPGNPKENYLIYDEEYLNMSAAKYISSEIVKEKERLMNLLITFSKNSYLSYSYYNVIDTKEANPSSIIFRINSGNILEFNYEDDKLSINYDLITQFNKGLLSETILDSHSYHYDSKQILSAEFSPSSFGDFFNNKLAFVLQYIFGIKVQEPDDPYVVISDSDRGTLFHAIVKGFEKGKISQADFVKKGLQRFDNFLEAKPAIVSATKQREKTLFERALINMYLADPGNSCVMAEKKIENCSIDGVLFKGTFDRLEKNSLGQYILVDYKTGTSLHHKNDDPESCIQGLLYAAMIKEKLNIDVSYCEFRYPFANDKVQIQCDTTNQTKLTVLIKQFKDAIINHDFSCLDDDYSFVEKYNHLISLVKELKR